jgi:hypothetical protein
MALDQFKNFAKVTVSTGYDASATSVVLSGGHAVKLPAVPFNATWWNSTDFADPTDDPNVEIVRVTAISTDTLTVTRGEEGISASTKNTASKTYRMIAGLTAKTFNTDFPTLSVGVANGRLTLESGVPISTTNQTAKTTVYYAPYQGNRISLYDGAIWIPYTFSELTLPLGTLVADKNYDVFIYNNAGTPALEMSAAWASDTARTDALALQDGIYVKSGTATRRYVGSFRTTTTTTTEDSMTSRFLWNNSNRVYRAFMKTSNAGHTYNGAERPWNNDASNAINFVSGLPEELISLSFYSQTTGVAGVYAIGGIGLDSTTTFYANGFFNVGITGTVVGHALVEPQIGYHRITAMESSASTGAASYNSYIINGQINA